MPNGREEDLNDLLEAAKTLDPPTDPDQSNPFWKDCGFLYGLITELMVPAIEGFVEVLKTEEVAEEQKEAVKKVLKRCVKLLAQMVFTYEQEC